MRYSTRPNDPGYENWIQHPRCVPFFNGEPLRNCVTADEEAGYAVVHKLVNGQPVIFGDQIATEELSGNVRVEKHDDDP